MDYKKQAEEFFKNDLFATIRTGIKIEEVEPSRAKCSMAVTKEHLNAVGTVMGGAIFTLVDFSFGVAANAGNPTTVTLSSDINFLSAARTEKLFAEAKAVKDGRSTCVYQVNVTDDGGKAIASAVCTGFRTGK